MQLSEAERAKALAHGGDHHLGVRHDAGLLRECEKMATRRTPARGDGARGMGRAALLGSTPIRRREMKRSLSCLAVLILSACAAADQEPPPATAAQGP